MPTSRVPQAIDALLDLCRAAEALAEVTITDGPPLTNLVSGRHLFIGWAPGGVPAASIAQNFASAGARRRDEDFTIAGYAEYRSGDIDMQPARTAVFGLVAAVETILRATDDEPEAPTLRGAVQWAHLTAGDLVQPQTADGVLAGLSFTVACHARL
jgi:hypothetical protein